MKILKVTLIALLAVCLTMGAAMAKPGKGKGKGQDKSAVHENRGAAARAAAHLRNALRKAARAQGEQPGAPGAPADPVDAKPGRRYGTLNSAEEALGKLERARWAHNPNDTRGQGNMGNVDMLDPYGHDKDSDRLELYGNRGRVIREVPEPEPPPEEPPPEPPDPEPPPDFPPF